MGQRFGPSSASVQKVVSYLTSKGLTVDLVPDNHFTVLAHATVQQAAAAFNTTITDYKLPTPDSNGIQTFFSFQKALKVPSTIGPSISHVEGLESYTRAKPRFKKMRKAPSSR